MPTISVKEFHQLIKAIPLFEEFAREHLLTSISLVKTPNPNSDITVFYLCYVHKGEVHGLDVAANIGRLFSRLVGLSPLSGIFHARDMQLFDQSNFEKFLKPTEISLISYSIDFVKVVTPNELVNYAQQTFNIECNLISHTKHSDDTKKRKLSDEEKDSSAMSPNKVNTFFRNESSDVSLKKLEAEIDKLPTDKFSQLIINLSRKHDLTTIIGITPKVKPD